MNDILTPMNHREIEYYAKKLPGCDIPGSPACSHTMLEWIEETGKRVFDEYLVMDYGTDCLRLYLMFENTPKEKDAPYYESWQEGALEGIYKFLGRYRRIILACDEWNRRGNYNKEEICSKEDIENLNLALDNTAAKIKKYIARGNTMPNRHNIVSVLMELLNSYQKVLKTGEIVASLHARAVRTAVPNGGREVGADSVQGQQDRRNPSVTKLCQDFIILMAPYAPYLSAILWKEIAIMKD